MKSIRVKSYSKLIEDIKLDGDTENWNGKLKKRIIDAIRLAKECRKAAEIAKENGDDENAAWLEQRAEDYETAAKNWNQDILDDEPEENNIDTDKADKTDSSKSDKASDRAAKAAANAKAAADAAQASAEKAQEAADELKDKGEDNTKAQEAADQAKEKAEEAEQAAEEAKQHAKNAKEAEEAGDDEKAESEANKAEEAAKKAKSAAKNAKDSAEGSDKDKSSDNRDKGNESDDNESDSSNSSESSNGEESSDSSSSSSSSDDSEESEQNDSSNSDSSSNQSDSESDSSNSENSGDQSDSDEDEESESDNAPVKDPFADDEDIPSLPKPGQQGQEPRDATVDDIIKQLKGLEGEAKRGAIDGLTDLVNKKTESLHEAFKKSIREFSDEEWDDMNDETIERIEKVKHIDTIDDVSGIKAKFKGWADNDVARQELADEEKKNIQKDVLAKRAKEKELDRYNKLETLKDFEIDFENCIRDQVEMVMQEYQSYDELNPEYEDEDVIMKADVQRMLPSEAIPTVAIFFDQSSSWSANDVEKGKKAIATVKQKYVDTGLCKLDIWYFADKVRPTPYGIGGSTTAWPEIVKTIADNDYKNVIIMTDDDMNDWNNHGESYTVEGCVWWIWRYGLRAENLPKQVKGMQHNFECSFS